MNIRTTPAVPLPADNLDAAGDGALNAGRAAVLVLLGGVSIGLAALLVSGFRDRLRGVVPEDMWIDLASPWVLVVATAVLALSTLRVQTGRGLLLVLWLGVICGLMGMREMDLHSVLSPLNIHLIGLSPEHAMRFRTNWWLKAETPVIARAVWGIALLAVAMLVMLPFAFARFHWLQQFRRGNKFARLVIIGGVLLVMGMVIDDLARKLTNPTFAQACEESVEFAGQLCLLAAAGVIVFRPRELSADHGHRTA
jgi:hypothetical protein